MRGWRGIVAATALAVSLGSAQPARAGFLEDAGWGSLTVLSNIVYMPVKLVYATLGGLTGGLALGLDRICALLAGETSIREVIPFPKTTQAVDLMCDAPSTVDPKQLRELHIRVAK